MNRGSRSAGTGRYARGGGKAVRQTVGQIDKDERSKQINIDRSTIEMAMNQDCNKQNLIWNNENGIKKRIAHLVKVKKEIGNDEEKNKIDMNAGKWRKDWKN